MNYLHCLYKTYQQKMLNNNLDKLMYYYLQFVFFYQKLMNHYPFGSTVALGQSDIFPSSR